MISDSSHKVLKEDIRTMNIAHNIEQHLQLHARKTALIFEQHSYTYSDVDELSNRVANSLHHLGIRSGERVALFLPNIPAFVFAYLGIQKIGAVAVSVNASLTRDEVTFILNDSATAVVITTHSLREHVAHTAVPSLQHMLIAEGPSGTDLALPDLMDQASPRAQAVAMWSEDPAAIVYTSGTTGFPKGATLSHGNIVFNMQMKQRYCAMGPDDRLLLCMPLFHCFGQNAIMNSGLYAGATLILHRRFDPEPILRSVAEDQVTMFFGVPTTYILLFDRATVSQLQSVRYYFSAAAPLPTELARKWRTKYGLDIHQGYGLTETAPFTSYNHHLKLKLGSIGTPIEQVEMDIVHPDTGEAVDPDMLGEIVVRGPNVMLGYWNSPEATAQVIKDDWFYTGDIGRKDQEGYFYIIDRVKDMINVAGMKVYPTEVENILYRHPAVREAAVYGVPDTIMGENVIAAIQLKSNYQTTERELMGYCRQHLAAFKVPAAIKFVTTIPKNPTGKVLKRVLREQT